MSYPYTVDVRHKFIAADEPWFIRKADRRADLARVSSDNRNDVRLLRFDGAIWAMTPESAFHCDSAIIDALTQYLNLHGVPWARKAPRPALGGPHSFETALADMKAHPGAEWAEDSEDDNGVMVYRWNGTALEWFDDGAWHPDENDWSRCADGKWTRFATSSEIYEATVARCAADLAAEIDEELLHRLEDERDKTVRENLAEERNEAILRRLEDERDETVLKNMKD